MPRIKLIVTGDMEKLALHKSLSRFFPDKLNCEEVIWDKPRKLHCATSYRLRSLKNNSGKLSKPMKDIAQAMFDEILRGKTGQPADLVIVIDDIEIANIDQENIIIEHFRAAVEHIFKEKRYSSNTEDRYRTILREKCSFHLLRPMIEVYLFGDPNALQLAGVSKSMKPQLIHPTDVEKFETNDPEWLPTCKANNENKRKDEHNPITWWYQERHPKLYLEHLSDRCGIFYDETNYGKKALEEIAWTKVPKCETDTSYLRSLFEDIADWFEILNPLGMGDKSQYVYPAKSVYRDELLLRNL